jgi:translation initiation factor IF-3
VNERIRIPQVRLIDASGSQVGIVPTRDALRMAREAGLDLVEISPTARPPVCKILDFGKYKYQQQKKQREAKKKQQSQQLKEMHFRPITDEHDYNFKTKHIKEFLSEGLKVKATVVFRGREMMYQETGWKIIQRLQEDLKELANPEGEAKLEGKNLVILFVPKPRAKAGAKVAQNEEQSQRGQAL